MENNITNLIDLITPKDFDKKYRPLKYSQLEFNGILTIQDLIDTDEETFADKAGNKLNSFQQFKKDILGRTEPESDEIDIYTQLRNEFGADYVEILSKLPVKDFENENGAAFIQRVIDTKVENLLGVLANKTPISHKRTPDRFAEKYKKLREEIINNKEKFIDLYNDNYKPIILPQDCSSNNFLDNWKNFLLEYCNEPSLIPIDQQEIFRGYLNGFGKGEISKIEKKNRHPESIRLILKEHIDDLNNFIENPKSGSRFSIDSSLAIKYSEIIELLDRKKYFPFQLLLETISNKSHEDLSLFENGSIQILLESLGCCELEDTYSLKRLNEERIIIRSKDKTEKAKSEFKDIARLTLNALNSNIIPLSEIDLLEQVRTLASEENITYNEELILAIIYNFNIISQVDKDFYLKSVSGSQVYLALKELNGIDTLDRIYETILSLFPNEKINGKTSYKQLILNNKDIFFNIDKLSLYGINTYYPKFQNNENIDNIIIDSIIEILNASNTPLHIRSIYKQLLSLFPDKLHSQFKEGTIFEKLRLNSQNKFKNYNNKFFSTELKSFTSFVSKEIPKSLKSEVSEYIKKEKDCSIPDIINFFKEKYDIGYDQIEYWFENSYIPSLAQQDLTLNNPTTNIDSNQNEIENIEEEVLFPETQILQEISLDIIAPKNTKSSVTTDSDAIGKIDYIKRAILLKKLGDKGEELVLDFEIKRLISAGKHDLAKKVKRVSLESDKHGYDILSYESEGAEIERYIEVKATKAKAGEANFYLSENELNTARGKDNYYIYMVYDIQSTNPFVWEIPNPFSEVDSNIQIKPINYKVTINTKKS